MIGHRKESKTHIVELSVKNLVTGTEMLTDRLKNLASETDIVEWLF
jgi:hypothetical protein